MATSRWPPAGLRWSQLAMNVLARWCRLSEVRLYALPCWHSHTTMRDAINIHSAFWTNSGELTLHNDLAPLRYAQPIKMLISCVTNYHSGNRENVATRWLPHFISSEVFISVWRSSFINGGTDLCSRDYLKENRIWCYGVFKRYHVLSNNYSRQ